MAHRQMVIVFAIRNRFFAFLFRKPYSLPLRSGLWYVLAQEVLQVPRTQEGLDRPANPSSFLSHSTVTGITAFWL